MSFRFTLRNSVYFDLRSTSVIIAPLWLRPITVSASQSPMRSLASTTLGRSSIDTLSGICPRRSGLP